VGGEKLHAWARKDQARAWTEVEESIRKKKGPAAKKKLYWGGNRGGEEVRNNLST